MLPWIYDIELRKNKLDCSKPHNVFRFGVITHVDIPIDTEGFYFRIAGDTSRTVYERANLIQDKGVGLSLLGSEGT